MLAGTAKKKKKRKHSALARVNSDSMSDSDGQLLSTLSERISKEPSAPSNQALSTAMSVVPPKPVLPRTHHDQKANPLVKPMDLPAHTVEAGSSLTTKQRIAAGLPAVPSVTKSIFHPTKPLASLSFKKNKPPVPIAIQAKDSRWSSVVVASPSSPNTMDNPSFPMDVDQSAGPFEPFSVDIGCIEQRSPKVHVAASISSKRLEEFQAEIFLQEMDIPLLHAPLS
ncbi:hypothetical protein F5I97DRAFT_1593133 [Phlebopus sp. FC_14]|nr:hypothetical protein F5I97DRAFT_1593133 [Phlebopus sp. FC_14]